MTNPITANQHLYRAGRKKRQVIGRYQLIDPGYGSGTAELWVIESQAVRLCSRRSIAAAQSLIWTGLSKSIDNSSCTSTVGGGSTAGGVIVLFTMPPPACFSGQRPVSFWLEYSLSPEPPKSSQPLQAPPGLVWKSDEIPGAQFPELPKI